MTNMPKESNRNFSDSAHNSGHIRKYNLNLSLSLNLITESRILKENKQQLPS